MKKFLSPLFVVIALFASLLAHAEGEQPMTLDGATTVTAEQLLDLVDSLDELVIIDARGQGDYDRGHIPDVVRIKNTEINADNLAANIATKSTPVAFYCNSTRCARSAGAVRKAKAEGYSSIYWFRGGIAEWKAKGLPVEL